ncbi:hypothetical protein [Roseomonas sp. 18066]|uniref:hypothetical protein n=1 Tax=Roseomonas sp. 18066 TaxID=2681412 RepID=UPI0013570523|nr:hypothetical protein [Roseomonas sp. 18066]
MGEEFELSDAALVSEADLAADARFLDDLRATSSFMTFLLTAGQEVPDATIRQVNQLLSVFAADLATAPLPPTPG